MKSWGALVLASILGAQWWFASPRDKGVHCGVDSSVRGHAARAQAWLWSQAVLNNSHPRARRQLGAEPWWRTHQKKGSSASSATSNKHGDEIVTKNAAGTAKKTTSPGGAAAAAKGDPTYAGSGDGFFKGSSGVKHGSAAWDFLHERPNVVRWPSSWRRHHNGSDALTDLCGPFVHWLQHTYVPRARSRAPVVCSMVPHQGLGDQFKGVTRCWAAALLSQRPLYFDHGKSR